MIEEARRQNRKNEEIEELLRKNLINQREYEAKIEEANRKNRENEEKIEEMKNLIKQQEYEAKIEEANRKKREYEEKIKKMQSDACNLRERTMTGKVKPKGFFDYVVDAFNPFKWF